MRLIDENGKQLGIMPLRAALQQAQNAGLDLVEVAPQASPPVCRIMDYGKFKYEQSKKAQEARKKQSYIQVKEVKMRPRTDVHDLEVKKRQIRKFIGEGNKVKVTVRFRGREIVHAEMGVDLLKRVAEEMNDIAMVEQMSKFEGRTVTMVLAPRKAK